MTTGQDMSEKMITTDETWEKLKQFAVMPHRKAVSPPLPQVASMQRRGCASRAARKS